MWMWKNKHVEMKETAILVKKRKKTITTEEHFGFGTLATLATFKSLNTVEPERQHSICVCVEI